MLIKAITWCNNNNEYEYNSLNIQLSIIIINKLILETNMFLKEKENKK